ncbi:MAG: glycosyltransferase family 8 protein [Alphaproteobacteria bacterium]|nr:glycosyltransferase family 8 protein [Alphaproteobacteria bacterium]
MLWRKKTAHIALITDSNYVMPTIVAVKSMLFHKAENVVYHVYIVTTNLTAEDVAKLQSLQRHDFYIQIVNREDLIAQYMTLMQHRHVSHAALLKFFLPQIFPQLDKILYIDSDVLVQGDLSALYATDIGTSYAGVVRDTLSVLGREYMQSLGIANKYYFNSGVLLLNLQKFREDDICQKLIDFRTEKEQDFMDQDAFNGVIGHQVRYLSYRYNFLNYYLTVMDKKQLSELFEEDLTKYADDEALYRDCVILHLGGKEKPWLEDMGFLSELYRRYADLIIAPDIPFSDRIKTMLNKIFSAKNVGIHKVITICGIKLKFRVQRLIQKRKLEELQNQMRCHEHSVWIQLSKLEEHLSAQDELLQKMTAYAKENYYATLFRDTTAAAEWLENTSFTLVGGAANYSFMFILFKVLETIQPQQILEFGLGQTSRMTTRYVTHQNKKAFLDIVEHDNEWIATFSKQLPMNGHTVIHQKDIIRFELNGVDSDKYATLDDVTTGKKFDLIIIDGPFGYERTYPRTNVLDLIPQHLNDDFVIILDDVERQGEQNTAQLIVDKLRDNHIEFQTSYCYGYKRQLLLTSKSLHFLHWFSID